jgi:acetylornithine deacetylase/succinyl-diaminopimelate desuccinylase-like protein
LFTSFIQSIAPPGIKVTIQQFHSNDPVLVSRNQSSVQGAARAIAIGFGKAPVFIREGGSIPVVTLFKQILGLDTLLLGWGCPDDGAHSPNERLRLDHFHRGIRAAAALMYELAP